MCAIILAIIILFTAARNMYVVLTIFQPRDVSPSDGRQINLGFICGFTLKILFIEI